LCLDAGKSSLKPKSSGAVVMLVAQNKISSFLVVIATSDFAGGGTLSDDADINTSHRGDR
jgi:hypothetical protein